MSRLVTACAALDTGLANIEAIRARLAALRAEGELPAAAQEALTGLEGDLEGLVRGPVSAAEDELIILQAEELGADAQAAVTALQGLLAAARLTTQADVDAADAAVGQSLEQFAAGLEGAGVPAVPAEALANSVRALANDIEQQTALGDRVSKVVSTVVGVGKTAVKLLA